MKTIKDYFDIRELVCKDVYDRFKDQAWTFFDPRLLETMLVIREAINKPIYVNNWDSNGKLSERGLRCNLCATVDAKTSQHISYVSAHIQGEALDFNVSGMTCKAVRQWIVNNKHLLPYPIRLELDTTTWVHLDVRNDDITNKIKTFRG